MSDLNWQLMGLLSEVGEIRKAMFDMDYKRVAVHAAKAKGRAEQIHAGAKQMLGEKEPHVKNKVTETSCPTPSR